MTVETFDEIITEFYGISTVARKVENVAITRSGRISHWTDKRGYVYHLMTQKDARNEVARIFKLVELVEVHPRTPNDKRLEILMDLQAKASEMWPSRNDT